MSLQPGAPAEGPHVQGSSTSEAAERDAACWKGGAEGGRGVEGHGGGGGGGVAVQWGSLPFTVQPTLEMSQQICRSDFHLPRPRGH